MIEKTNDLTHILNHLSIQTMRPESEVTAEAVWIFPLLGTLEGACGERP